MANKSTGIYGHFGNFSAANQLPNVAGATVQTSELSVGDLATFGGALYICTTATLGAAVWVAVGGSGSTPQSDVWTPVLADSAAIVTMTQPLVAYYTRVNGATPVVSGSLFFGYEATANGTPIINITGLPFPLAGTTDITLTIGAGPSLQPALPDVNTIRLTFAAPLSIGNAGSVMLAFMYEPAA